MRGDPSAQEFKVVTVSSHPQAALKSKYIERPVRQAKSFVARNNSKSTTMAPVSNFLVLAVAAGSASAFVAPSTFARPATTLSESFGFDFAEDSYKNTPDQLLGEANYKQWVNKIDANSFLNRQVCTIRRYLLREWLVYINFGRGFVVYAILA